jgi:hypothetical protein
MMVSIATTARPQQRYDHRLRHLGQGTGDVTVATHLGVPRSTARGWLSAAPTVVVCLDVVDLTEPELRQEVLAAVTRPEALGAAPARAGPATSLRVSSHRRAPTHSRLTPE